MGFMKIHPTTLEETSKSNIALNNYHAKHNKGTASITF